MQFKTFLVPVMGGEQVEEEMNGFLDSHRIIDTRTELVSSASGTYWTFCIKYLGQGGGGEAQLRSFKPRVDFRIGYMRFSCTA